MDFMLTEEQRMLQKMTRDFAREEIEPHVREWEEKGDIPREIFDKMAKLGILGTTVPQEYGGAGMDNVSYLVMTEEIGRACSSLKTAIAVHLSLCATTVMMFGSEEQKRKFNITGFREENLTLNGHKGGGGCSPNPRRR